MPLDHINLVVPSSKFEPIIAFLLSSLAHMGFKEHMRPAPHVIGLGEQVPYLWIAAVDLDGVDLTVQEKFVAQHHVAFVAKDIKQVRQFHAAALKAGGVDNGAPGRRPQYYAGYYGAFVRDPACGVNFEVVFHGCPEDDEMLKKMEEDDE